jgi:hypothetical protein
LKAYKEEYQKINNTLTALEKKINNATKIDKTDKEKLLGKSDDPQIINIQGEGDDAKIIIPGQIKTFFHILLKEDPPQSGDTQPEPTDVQYIKVQNTGFNNINLDKEVKNMIDKLFISKDKDEPLKIEGLNLLTPDRPIDSPRYITFQGINAQEIKFIYPDLYKVEVYKTDSQRHQTLKTPLEIKEAIKTYLQNKVNEYNAILTGAKNNPISDTKANTKGAYSRLQKNFPKASPSLAPNDRRYTLFTYADLLNALGGEIQLDTIAEMLYYQNLTNTERQSNNLITEDITNTRNSFDISNKVKYTLQEYLIENNPKLQRTNS